eukprot:Hpha_TRINITY_DN13395_c0_g1::TRINITY_DN13395_c0_g1_i1::g.95280::m.95280
MERCSLFIFVVIAALARVTNAGTPTTISPQYSDYLPPGAVCGGGGDTHRSDTHTGPARRCAPGTRCLYEEWSPPGAPGVCQVVDEGTPLGPSGTNSGSGNKGIRTEVFFIIVLVLLLAVAGSGLVCLRCCGDEENRVDTERDLSDLEAADCNDAIDLGDEPLDVEMDRVQTRAKERQDLYARFQTPPAMHTDTGVAPAEPTGELTLDPHESSLAE